MLAKGTRRAVFAAALAAATVATVAVSASANGAEPSADPVTAAAHSARVLPAAAGVERAGVSGRTGDYDGNARQDILARDRATGALNVYLHSGAFQGTGTFRAPEPFGDGWGGMRWLAPARVSADRQDDAFSDVLAIRGGELLWYRHGGSYAGASTLQSGVSIGSGWEANDLVFTFDFDHDGYDDILARRAGTGDTYWYHNITAGADTPAFAAPELVIQGGADDVFQGLADVTGDSYPDFLFAQGNGLLGLFDFQNGVTYTLGWGWETIDAISLSDPDFDGKPDLIGRRESDGALLVYLHGVWQPTQQNTAYDAFQAPKPLGYNWQLNDVIT
jgi:hypothetical protein